MLKIFTSKKGLGDVSIIIFLITFFLVLGVALPYINASFDSSYNEFNTDIDGEYDDDGTITTISAGKILFSIVSIFFWTFGALNPFIDIMLMIFRVSLALLIYRQVRSGGG